MIERIYPGAELDSKQKIKIDEQLHNSAFVFVVFRKIDRVIL